MAIQLLSEIADMDVDRAIEYSQPSSQCNIGEVFAGKSSSCIADQDLKQSELNGREVQRAAVDPGLSHGDIDRDVSRREAIGPCSPLVQPAQNRPDAGNEFSRIERLRQVI